MAEFCKTQQIVQNRIFTPKIGELADATLETQIYHVFFCRYQLLRKVRGVQLLLKVNVKSNCGYNYR